MKASTLIAPSALMRSRIARSSGVILPLPLAGGGRGAGRTTADPTPGPSRKREGSNSSEALRSGYRLHAITPALGGPHQPCAQDDHWQRQPLAHVQARRLSEADELRVRLTNEFDQEAEDSIEEDEGPNELARLVPGLRPPEHPREDREEDDAFEDRLVELAWVP